MHQPAEEQHHIDLLQSTRVVREDMAIYDSQTTQMQHLFIKEHAQFSFSAVSVISFVVFQTVCDVYGCFYEPSYLPST